MENNKLREDITTIDTFLNINNKNPKAMAGKPVANGFIKTITNRYKHESESFSVYEDFGFPSVSNVFEIVEGGTLNERMDSFRMLSNERHKQYSMYDNISNDPIISSALDLYADDSTQTGTDGRRMWIQAENNEDEKIIQGIFDSTGFESKLWGIARSLAQYGDVYLELFYDKSIKNPDVRLMENKPSIKSAQVHKDYTTKLLEVDNLIHRKSDGFVLSNFSIVPDPENLFDLTVQGQTVAFARMFETDLQLYGIQKGGTSGIYTHKLNNEVRYYPPDKFVHIYIENPNNRNCDTYIVDLPEGKQFRFNIARGKSMIHDVYSAQRDLQLMEYSIMLNRVSRSSVLRVAQIEVGNMSKSNVQITLRKIKQIIESKLTMNTTNGAYQPYNNPGPTENFIYVPVVDGKGSISFDTVGGDVNIRDIVDLEYQQDKLFAGLKIPKTYFNYQEGLASFGSGGGLTKQDARYARTVKRIQYFLLEGGYRFLDLFLDSRGLSHLINKYEIKMVIPSSIEDEERDTLFSNKIELVKSFLEIVNSLSESDQISINTEELVDYIFNEIFDDPAVKDLFKIQELGSSMGDGEAGFGDVSGSPVEVDEPMGAGGFASDMDSGSSDSIEASPTGPSEDGLSGEFSGEWEDIEV